MAWCKKARVTRARWMEWTPYHAQNSAGCVWELYR